MENSERVTPESEEWWIERLRKPFGDRIRELREWRGLSQDDLGEQAHLHRNQVGFVERAERRPNLVTIGKLAYGLDISLADLFATFTEKFERGDS